MAEAATVPREIGEPQNELIRALEYLFDLPADVKPRTKERQLHDDQGAASESKLKAKTRKAKKLRAKKVAKAGAKAGAKAYAKAKAKAGKMSKRAFGKKAKSVIRMLREDPSNGILVNATLSDIMCESNGVSLNASLATVAQNLQDGATVESLRACLDKYFADCNTEAKVKAKAKATKAFWKNLRRGNLSV